MSQGIQVIARAAAILRVLRDSDAGLSLGQIAERVELPRSTVQRIVNALIDERFVVADKSAGGYCVGTALLSFARPDRRSVAESVRPYLSKLSEATGETVDLTQFRDDHLVFIDQIVGSHRLRTVATVGETFPMTTTANGKATLAELTPEDVDRILKLEIGSGKNSAARRKALLQEIDAVKLGGYALDLDEHTDGISAAGACFHDTTGQIFAVSIPAPSHRFARNKDALVKQLLDTVTEITSAMR